MKFPPWSYSSLSMFEQCPKKWQHKYVLKDYVEPPQQHLLWGLEVHKAFEDRMKAGKPLPEHLKTFELFMGILSDFTETPPLVEHQLGLDEDLKPAEFFGDNTWYRGIIDLALIKGDKAVVLDYKTGKRKPDFTQLELFAAGMFVHQPQIEKIKMTFVWTKFGTHDSKEVKRDWTPLFWEKMLPRIARMRYAFDNNEYFEKPSPLCGWCYAKTCKFCKMK